jgi:hypothetical protein
MNARRPVAKGRRLHACQQRGSNSTVVCASATRHQAVIAIENARVFDEVQAWTRELTESLQRQTDQMKLRNDEHNFLLRGLAEPSAPKKD